MRLQYMSRARVVGFATHLLGSEGCSGGRRDDRRQPTLQFGDSSSGLRWLTILGRRRGTTTEVLHPRAHDSPTDHGGDQRRGTVKLEVTGMREGGYRPYHALKHWGKHLIPRRYPDNLSPFDIQLPILLMDEVPALLILIRGGCREADVGSDALKVCLLEAKVESERRVRYVLWKRPGRFVVFTVYGGSADV